jgi:hypothetical protein
LSSFASGQDFDPKAVREAITRATTWLEKDMVAWRETNDCAACHHGPMYVWSSQVVRRQGYRVNERQLRDYARWMIEDDAARVFPKPSVENLANSSSAADRMTAAMMGHRNLSQPTLYLGHALNSLPLGDPLATAGWKKLLQHWAEAQGEDGSFTGRQGWPPIFNSPQILTLFAATALNDRHNMQPSDGELAKSLAQIHKRANRYLEGRQPDGTHQGIVLRLLQPEQTPGDRDPLRKELLDLQRADGGWSQTADRASDALATGQSLYVLSRTGLLQSDPHVIDGIKFLAQSQAADGTWPIVSRANPVTGRPADDLNPITYAAAAWATIGMASYVPQTP